MGTTQYLLQFLLRTCMFILTNLREIFVDIPGRSLVVRASNFPLR